MHGRPGRSRGGDGSPGGCGERRRSLAGGALPRGKRGLRRIREVLYWAHVRVFLGARPLQKEESDDDRTGDSLRLRALRRYSFAICIHQIMSDRTPFEVANASYDVASAFVAESQAPLDDVSAFRGQWRQLVPPRRSACRCPSSSCRSSVDEARGAPRACASCGQEPSWSAAMSARSCGRPAARLFLMSDARPITGISRPSSSKERPPARPGTPFQPSRHEVAIARLTSRARVVARCAGAGHAHPSMERAIIVRGRLSGPRRIDLDEPVEDVTGEVEVVVRPVEAKHAARRSLADVLRSLPAGTRSKEDIDRQIAEERDSWGDR
jgi:hypothetical protein